MDIQAVIFDFGGIIAYTPPREKFDKWADELGADADKFFTAFWDLRRDYDALKIDTNQYWRVVAEASGFVFDLDKLPQLIARETSFWTSFDEGMVGYVASLRAHGYSTAMLSNLPPAMGAELRATHGLLDNFDQITFSFELGLVKPQAEIYLHCCRELGVAPVNALFLDDRIENVEGARQAGLRAEVYTDWETFVARTIPAYGLPETDEARRQ